MHLVRLLQVLAALSDDMPLALAHDTLARMLSSVTHRRRQLQMVKALHRAQAVALRLQRVDWLSQRVVVTEDSACHACKRLLGHTYRQHVFMRHPTGVILCTRCGKSAQQQQQQPGPGSLAPEPATVSLAAGSGSPSQGGG